MNITHEVHLQYISTLSNTYTIARYLIQETYADGSATQGGSSFRIQAVGSGQYTQHTHTGRLSNYSTNVMCPYRDYFNGTYLFCCTIHTRTTHVTVNMTHTEFGAYNGEQSVTKNIYDSIVAHDEELPGGQTFF